MKQGLLCVCLLASACTVTTSREPTAVEQHQSSIDFIYARNDLAATYFEPDQKPGAFVEPVDLTLTGFRSLALESDWTEVSPGRWAICQEYSYGGGDDYGEAYDVLYLAFELETTGEAVDRIVLADRHDGLNGTINFTSELDVPCRF